MQKSFVDQLVGCVLNFQMEFHSRAGVDAGACEGFEAGIDEIWNGPVGKSPGNRIASWKNDTTTEWPNSKACRAAIFGR